MHNKVPLIIASSVVGIILLMGSIFAVEQRQFALIFQFGEIVRSVREPGLHFKVPFIQNIMFFDNRILNVSLESTEVTASDEKKIIVNAFAKYRIDNPVEFYKTINNIHNIRIQLNRILDSSIRRVIGTKPLVSLLSHERREIMDKVSENVNKETARLGVNVIDVRLVRADLPKENSDAVCRRMQTEREKEAKQIRAEGVEIASKIKASAEKESKIVISESYKNSEITRGEGDSKAAKIYNAAYSRDPEFYKFHKSLGAYRATLNSKDTSFIISPDSDFLKILKLGK
jgi:membrane protease subunit HflC